VHAKTLLAQEIRALLTARKPRQGKRLDLEGSLRGISAQLRPQGRRGRPVQVRGPHPRVRGGPGRVTEPMLRARDALRAEYTLLHRELRRIVRTDDPCRRLMTVPGVGAVVSITFTSAIDDRAGSGAQRTSARTLV